MMTHHTIKVLGKMRLYDNSFVVDDDIYIGSYCVFEKGAVLRHKIFSGCKAGADVEVTVRVTQTVRVTRRYFLSARQIVPTTPLHASAAPKAAGSEVVSSVTDDVERQMLAEKQKPVAMSDNKLNGEADKNPHTSANFFYVDDAHAEIFSTATEMLANNPTRPVRILMSGPSGYGKTSLPEFYAKEVGLNFYRMNCAAIRDPEEWFGQRSARDGSTYFEDNEFIKRVTEGGHVIVLDEFNRIEPWLANTLYPLLDDAASTNVYNQDYKVGPNVVFVMTINLGYQFSGTFSVDSALMNRIDMFCEVGAMPFDKETNLLTSRFSITSENAAKIVETAKKIRDLEVVECSTRTTLQIARAVENGMSLRAAFQHIVVMRCLQISGSDSSRKNVIDAINVSLGTYRPTKFKAFKLLKV